MKPFILNHLLSETFPINLLRLSTLNGPNKTWPAIFAIFPNKNIMRMKKRVLGVKEKLKSDFILPLSGQCERGLSYGRL